jgi:hypothetical protein
MPANEGGVGMSAYLALTTDFWRDCEPYNLGITT